MRGVVHRPATGPRRRLQCTAAVLLALCCHVAAACDAANIRDALEGRSASFAGLRAMIQTMRGRWEGCDDSGNAVTVAVDKQGNVSGDMAKYWNGVSTRTFTACRWSGVRNYLSLNGGRYGISIRSVACAGAPFARDWEHGDTGELFLFGGPNKIDYMVVKVRDRIYAVVRKSRATDG